MISNADTSLEGLLVQSKRAAARRAQRVSTAHVLLAMLQADRDAAQLLTARGVREIELLSAIRVVDDEPDSALEVAVERARKLAQRLGARTTTPLHLLAAIAKEPRTSGHRCLEKLGAPVPVLCDDVLSALGEPAGGAAATAEPATKARWAKPAPRAAARAAQRLVSPALEPRPARLPAPPRPTTPPKVAPVVRALTEPSAAGTLEAAPPGVEEGAVTFAVEARADVDVGASPNVAETPYSLDREAFPVLAKLGRNLTELAYLGQLDPVVGRDSEIDRLEDILAKRRGNNPVLVGPSGVGKTAIVEALAQRFASARGARARRRVIVEISAGQLVAGTGVRGALSDRIAKLRAEVQQAEGDVVLFVDEIHALFSGSHDGPDDLATELKASLARGELPCVGATTEAEYRKHFERDAALARRFARVHVGEPSAEATRVVIARLAPRYAEHHEIAIGDDALDAAVELSSRYLVDRHQPEKSIGVVDLAAARARRRGLDRVGRREVAEVIASEAHVPVERLLATDGERLLELERELAKRVVGQRQPLSRIAATLRKGAAGFRGKRPLGTFLLLGPTGVGKTETAKAIADLLYPAGGFARFDMSEFSEPHAIARFLGAPPGYVGHDDGGQLTNALRRRPYQLVLLDEVEKAHPEVLLALLPLLDEGRLTDAKGRTVDATQCVIVMTSNLGAHENHAVKRLGFDDAERGELDLTERVLIAARRSMPPELWNRIDEPIVFAGLDRDEVRAIAERMLETVAAQARRERSVELTFDASVVDLLLRAGGYDEALGARPMRRAVGRLVEGPIADAMLAQSIAPGARIAVRGGAESIAWAHVD